MYMELSATYFSILQNSLKLPFDMKTLIAWNELAQRIA